LPDWLNYIVAGGTASITFSLSTTRFLAEKREQDAQKTFSIIVTVMTTVLIVGTVIAEIFTPQFARWDVSWIHAEQMQLCVRLTRILLPAQIFFYGGRRRLRGAALAPVVSVSGTGTVALQRRDYRGWRDCGPPVGIASLAYGAVDGQHSWTVSDQCYRRGQDRHRIPSKF